MFQEHGRGISAVFFKGFYEAPAGVFINSGILEELFSAHMAVDQTGRWDKFHIDLDTFSWMVHLLVRLGDVLWVGRFNSGKALLFQEAVKAWDRAAVAALGKFYPEDDPVGIRIAPAHIRDELDLLRGMPVGLISDGSVSDTILLSIPDKG